MSNDNWDSVTKKRQDAIDAGKARKAAEEREALAEAIARKSWELNNPDKLPVTDRSQLAEMTSEEISKAYTEGRLTFLNDRPEVPELPETGKVPVSSLKGQPHEVIMNLIQQDRIQYGKNESPSED